MSNRSATPTAVTAHWVSIADAAQVLGTPAVTLRRACDAHARKSKDGAVEAAWDGLRARKLGRLWRVQLGTWAAPSAGAS